MTTALFQGGVVIVSTDGTHHILYDDGYLESLNLLDEACRYCSASPTRPSSISSHFSAVLKSMLAQFSNQLLILLMLKATVLTRFKTLMNQGRLQSTAQSRRLHYMQLPMTHMS